jgi:multicomponent Na+:H+ antiporter subunit B
MTLIVKTVTRLTVGLILIYGIYIVLQGHISPGGGFAGGVIVALSFIHLVLAFGREAVFKKMNEARGLVLLGAGAIVFLSLITLGFLGIGFARSGSRVRLFSAGIMPLCDIAIGLMVASGLIVMFLALIGLASKEKRT